MVISLDRSISDCNFFFCFFSQHVSFVQRISFWSLSITVSYQRDISSQAVFQAQLLWLFMNYYIHYLQQMFVDIFFVLSQVVGILSSHVCQVRLCKCMLKGSKNQFFSCYTHFFLPQRLLIVCVSINKVVAKKKKIKRNENCEIRFFIRSIIF